METRVTNPEQIIQQHRQKTEAHRQQERQEAERYVGEVFSVSSSDFTVRMHDKFRQDVSRLPKGRS
ncbi:hypothetical protein [Deinococcus aestuarii]|uniref:hypothetical protein n=1 Tax=Deinococcus aestuarii TaxID=2774531 RepID=UPI001C0C76B1|nr:hypothetical protein [Deinococcus aestuarii]